jgi:hypothetical protein
MAINTLDAKRAEIQQGCRCVDVTVKAIGGNMGSDKRKPAFLMYLRDIVNDP